MFKAFLNLAYVPFKPNINTETIYKKNTICIFPFFIIRNKDSVCLLNFRMIEMVWIVLYIGCSYLTVTI